MRFLVLVTALVATLALAAQAQAGRVVATGHPLDRACATRAAPDPADGCSALKAAVDWARAGAPDAAKPLLLLQPNDGPVQTAITNAWAGGAPPSLQTVDPAASYVAQMAITTDAFSAVVVASDRADGTPAGVPAEVAAHLRSFFEQGGGLVLLAGSPTALLPLGARTAAGPRPYATTADGDALGLGAAACCDLTRTFAEPGPFTALRVAERDGSGAPATLFGSGLVEAGTIVPPVALPAGTDQGAGCTSRRAFSIRVRRHRGLTYETVSVKVGSRRPIVLRGGRIGSFVDLRGLPAGRYAITIEVRTTDGQTFTGSRRYETCSPKKNPGSTHPL